jgi:hypothetical protein
MQKEQANHGNAPFKLPAPAKGQVINFDWYQACGIHTPLGQTGNFLAIPFFGMRSDGIGDFKIGPTDFVFSPKK